MVTAKELLAEGHEVVCFERAASLGGVFRFGDDGVVWESCRLTSSALLTAFSDFPMTAAQPHPPIAEYVAYLNRYAETFGVLPHIRFDTNVESMTNDTSGWTLRVRRNEQMYEETFDAVAVCSGLHQHPHVPEFPGQESFRGQIIHASEYRRPAQVRGKKVLVIGAGESGADITAEVAANASETVLSLRRGVAVVPRNSFGSPRDYQTTRLHNSPAHWIFQTRNPADDARRRAYRWTFVPFLFVDKALQLGYRYLWEYLPIAGRPIEWKVRRLTDQLLAESGGTVNEQFGTKSDDFIRAIAEGSCRRVAALVYFDGGRAIFSGGAEFQPDLVILCTGFETRIPFLPAEIAGAPRFLHTFHPETGASLGFIGFLRPAFGAIPPLAELQARWFAQVQSGRATLPPLAEMYRSIDRWKKFRAHFFRAVKGRLDHLVEFTCFSDELAARIGCKPSLRDLRKESRAFRKRFFEGPFVGAQYRLVGPHAKPEIARKVIENLPITHAWPDRWNLHLRWFLSRTLHRLRGAEFAPKLEIEA